MRKLTGFAFLCATLAVFAFSSNALTQQGKGQGKFGGFGGGPFGGSPFGGGVNLAFNPSVQEELKVTDEQKEKLKTANEDYRGKMRENFQSMQEKMAELKELPKEEFTKKMAELGKEMLAPLEKDVYSILKPEQKTRLKQIDLQQQGLRAFTTAEVEKDLSITDDQKVKFKGLMEENIKELTELMPVGGRGGVDPEVQKKMTALRKSYTEKAVDVLTEAQKASWKKMTGEPFEVKMVAPKRKDD
jgi:Spy/CpxP family protein refolding chaperone